MTSLDQLENETEASRVRVAELLDELRGRVSPGELVDQVVDFAGNGAAGDFARTLGRQVRDNPMASVLIGAGLAWLMLGDRRGKGRGNSDWIPSGWTGAAERGRETMSDMRDAAAGAGERVTGAAGRTAGGISDGASDAAGRAGAAVSDSAHRAGDSLYLAGDAAFTTAYRARDTAADVASRTRDAAADATSRARDAVASATSAVANRARDVSSGIQSMASTATGMARDVAAATSDTLQGAAERARGIGRSATELGSRAGSTATQMLHEQPLIAAGIGLAVGALIGAALPATETERRVFGETSDEWKARARQAATEQMDKAKRVAEHTYEAAKQEATHVGEEAVRAAQDEGFPAGTLRAEHERNEHARPEAK